MEAMIAAMTSTSLTSFNSEEGEEVDDEALLEAELAELMGITVVPKGHQRIAKKYNEDDPENVQLESGDEDNPELLEEFASLSPHSEDVPVSEILEHESMIQIEGGTGELVESPRINNVVTEEFESKHDMPYEQESIVAGLEEHVVVGNHADEILITPLEDTPFIEPQQNLSEPRILDDAKEVTLVMHKDAVYDKVVLETDNMTPLEKQIAAAKMLALKYKRAGDLEAAKDVLRMMRQLEDGHKVTSSPVQKKPSSPEEIATIKPNQGITINRQTAMERLREQASKALKASKLYEFKNNLL